MATAALSPRIVQLLGSGKVVAASSNTVLPSRHSEATKPRLVTKPIEEIRCGDRIPSELPLGLEPTDEPEPDPATWRLVELTVQKKDGTIVEVKLLRPLSWLKQAGVIQNGHFELAIEELDIEDRAAVLDVKRCPPMKGGEGQLVTGTFRHACDDLVELHVEGESEPIVCTSGHPIWSEDRHAFVEAATLKAGESLLPKSKNLKRVLLLKRRSQSAEVFNLEIHGVHTYHIGLSGLLVHNAILGNCTAIGRMDDLRKYKDRDDVDTWWKTVRIPDDVTQVTLSGNKAWLRERFEAGHRFILATDPNTLGIKRIPCQPNGFFTYMELRWLKQWGATIEFDYE